MMASEAYGVAVGAATLVAALIVPGPEASGRAAGRHGEVVSYAATISLRCLGNIRAE
jgi:hypothetical protein